MFNPQIEGWTNTNVVMNQFIIHTHKKISCGQPLKLMCQMDAFPIYKIDKKKKSPKFSKLYHR